MTTATAIAAPKRTLETNVILHGDCIAMLKTLPDESVHCCVTSPPYWGLRDYGVAGQIGMEDSPEHFIAKIVEVFREVRRVLRRDGTLWMNLGDSYCSMNTSASSNQHPSRGQKGRKGKVPGMPLRPSFRRDRRDREDDPHKGVCGLKTKDLVGIPWRTAFALQADGWYLRCDIIWHKPNSMPESIVDRPTKAHEYIFLMTKSARYHYDADAIKEAASENTNPRLSGSEIRRIQDERSNGRSSGKETAGKLGQRSNGVKSNESFNRSVCLPVERRNRRTVWTIATEAFGEAHFATFPTKLVEPCILAGCPPGGVVLDPFFGSGTTGMVAEQLGRRWIGIELNAQYIEIAKRRTQQTGFIFQEAQS